MGSRLPGRSGAGAYVARCAVLLCVFLLLPPAFLEARESFAAAGIGTRVLQDPGLEYGFVGSFSAATGDELPFWLHSGRWGSYSRSGERLYGLRAFAAQTYALPVEGLLLDWDMQWDLPDIAALPERAEHAYLNRGFLRLSYRGWEAAGGVLPLEKGSHDGDLSSGSLVLSRNARPVPRVYLGRPHYSSVPLTLGLVEFKGSISHAWLEQDRAVESPWLHEKDAYLRVNDPLGWGLSVYRGLIHEVVWAGTRADGTENPRSLRDFFRVLSSAGGGDDATVSEQINALGDTVGMWDAGIQLRRPSFQLLLYHQHFFEDGSGYRMGRREDREEQLARWRDGLSGVSFRFTERRPLTAVTYEYLDTRHQSGPGLHDVTGGWDSYYQHGLYRTGWTYHGRMIGPPLVTTAGSGAGLQFLHTRVEAHHLGLLGYLQPQLYYRAMATYSRSYGTYARNITPEDYATLYDPNHPDYDPTGGNVRGDDIFRSGIEQWAFSVEVGMHQGLFGLENVFGSAALGADFGDLREDGLGLLLSVGRRDRMPLGVGADGKAGSTRDAGSAPAGQQAPGSAIAALRAEPPLRRAARIVGIGGVAGGLGYIMLNPGRPPNRLHGGLIATVSYAALLALELTVATNGPAAGQASVGVGAGR